MRKLLASLLVLLAFGGGGAQAQVSIWTKNPATATSVSSAAFPLLAPDGTAAAPSYSFSSSTGTGLYFNNGVQIQAAGSAVGVFQSGALSLPSNANFGWAPGTGATLAAIDTTLARDAADTLAQRRSTNAQMFRVYNTFTDASNYERLDIGPNAAGIGANIFGVMTTFAGTGSNRTLVVGTASNSRMSFSTGNTISFNYLGANVIATMSATGLVVSAVGTNANQFRTTQATVPTITTNGGTSPVCVGSDSAMTCTEGTAPPAAATFTVTFQGTWGAAPSCIALRGTAGATPLVQNVVTSTTTVQVNLSANLVASEKFHIHCTGVA